MIRQAISCDICAAEKKQTNHWFVVCEQAGELRVSGWNSRNRLRAGTKHLCGQTCLHKLVDEFMARTIAGRPPATAEPAHPALAEVDASLTSLAAYADPVSNASDIAPAPSPEPPVAMVPAPVIARPAVLSMPPRPPAEIPAAAIAAIPPDDVPAYSSRRWRAEAWERERNRELRAVERHPDILRRRKGF